MALATICLLPSCNGYWSARARDLDQCILYNAGLGYGISADLRVSRLGAAVGLSWADTYGKMDWWTGARRYEEVSGGVPIAQLIGLLAVFDQLPELGQEAGLLLVFGTSMVQREILVRPQEPSREVGYGSVALVVLNLDKGPMRHRWIDAFGVEAGVFVGLGGERVGINLAELADWLLGFTTLDILSDDDVESVDEDDKNLRIQRQRRPTLDAGPITRKPPRRYHPRPAASGGGPARA